MAFVEILRKEGRNEILVLGSSVLLFEVSMISSDEKRKAVAEIIARVAKVTHLTERSKEKAEGIMKKCGINAMDALHIALSVENEVDVFITTDDDILKRRGCISKWVEVKNPKEVDE